jgi:hypothetical protein
LNRIQIRTEIRRREERIGGERERKEIISRRREKRKESIIDTRGGLLTPIPHVVSLGGMVQRRRRT